MGQREVLTVHTFFRPVMWCGNKRCQNVLDIIFDIFFPLINSLEIKWFNVPFSLMKIRNYLE